MRTMTAVALAALLVTAATPTTAHDGGNEPPLADAGLDQQVTQGAVVFLDGGGSVDPDGAIAGYRWEIRSPDGNRVAPRNDSAALTRFRPSRVGRYEVQLTVTDDDGRERSDTLYVDVVAASGEGSGNQSNPEGGPNEGSSSSGSSTGVSGTRTDGNRRPSVSLFGPAEATVGESATYSISATDSDGRVVEREFGGLLDGSGTETRHVFDSPGTHWVSVTVTDDDGATSTARKQVTVAGKRNLSVSIEGPSLVPDGTYASYTARVQSASGRLDYFWSPRKGNARQTDRTLNHLFTRNSGNKRRISVTVRDSRGKTATNSKLIAITKINSKGQEHKRLSPDVLDTSINKVSPNRSNSKGILTHTTYQISSEVIDTNNDPVWVTWRFDDGTVKKKRVPAAGNPKTASVLKSFVKNRVDGKELAKPRRVNVTVVAEDNSGLTDESSYTTRIQRLRDYGELQFNVFSSTVEQGEAVTIQFHSSGGTVVDFGDGTRLRFHEDANTAEHVYDEPGNYTIAVFAMDANSVSQRGTEQVRVAKTTFVEYHFEQNTTRTESITKAERPAGEGWQRDGLDHVEVASRTIKERVLPDSERVTDRMTERGWSRARETTKKETTTESRVVSSSPGSEWSLAERSVKEEQRIVDWRRHEVDQPSRTNVPDEWRYKGTDTETQTLVKTSTTRPGSDWDRGSRAGRVRDGYDYETFDDRGHPGWSYRSSFCSREVELMGGDVCIDTDYRYKRAEYDTKYRWTKERTSTVDVYEVPVRDTVTLHRYEREVSTQVRYIVWQKEKIELENHYVWKRTETRTREEVSLSKPASDIYIDGSLEEHEHDCADTESELSETAC